MPVIPKDPHLLLNKSPAFWPTRRSGYEPLIGDKNKNVQKEERVNPVASLSGLCKFTLICIVEAFHCSDKILKHCVKDSQQATKNLAIHAVIANLKPTKCLSVVRDCAANKRASGCSTPNCCANTDSRNR